MKTVYTLEEVFEGETKIFGVADSLDNIYNVVDLHFVNYALFDAKVVGKNGIYHTFKVKVDGNTIDVIIRDFTLNTI